MELHLKFTVQVQSFGLMYKGDPYLGGREAEIKRKNKEIEDLKKELANVKKEFANFRKEQSNR